MSELLTAAQMRAIEQAAIESGEVTGLELMERAGRGVVEAVFEEWPELAKTSHRAVVLCGPGNNGGDGFVVARLLKEWGWQVEVFLYGDAAKLPPDARVNYERWKELGEVEDYDNYCDGDRSAFDPEIDVFVDSTFGTGLKRPLRSELESFYELSRNSYFGYKTVAVDVPSGLCSDSGRIIHEAECTEANDWWAFSSDLTVSFHGRKIGHMLADGAVGCGKVVVKDIGLPKSSTRLRVKAKRPLSAVPGKSEVVELVVPWIATKAGYQHKYTHGHALILSGGFGKTGAARLAARGALRIGAGLVTLGVPPNAQMEVASQITAIMLNRIEDADGLAATLNDKRLNALCIGPGFGTGERERALIGAALETKRPIVLDADALSARFFDKADALFGKLHDNCVLTPHAGEFARMFPDITEKLKAPATKGPAYSKVDATREAAKRAGCVVLFKGADSVIAAPNGQCSINSAHYERAAPWLATAGSGDVLAGFITGLLARGFTPMRAAETAAWLHVECALSFGPGLIAEDIAEEIPKVFCAIGL